MPCMPVLLAVLFYSLAGALTLPSVDGRRVQPLGAKTSVFLFTRTDCPISNRYAPEVRRLHALFAARGITFWLVYVDPAEPLRNLRSHLREYEYPFGALVDGKHELVKLAGARSTPEAAVFVKDRLVYRGRIDDRYAGPGKMRPAATKHDLQEVLARVAEGKHAAFRETQAAGCFIGDLR